MNTNPVLVVDDDAAIRRSLVNGLSAAGFAAIAAPSPAHARSMIERDRPSLVILDLEPPLLESVRFACRLRERHGGVPIVAVSGDSLGHYWASEIGANRFLPKPFSPEEAIRAATAVQVRSRFIRRPVRATPIAERVAARSVAPQPAENVGVLRRWWRLITVRFTRGSAAAKQSGKQGRESQRGSRGESPSVQATSNDR